MRRRLVAALVWVPLRVLSWAAARLPLPEPAPMVTGSRQAPGAWADSQPPGPGPR